MLKVALGFGLVAAVAAALGAASVIPGVALMLAASAIVVGMLRADGVQGDGDRAVRTRERGRGERDMR